MAQIAQLVLAAVALLVVLQTCQAQRRYAGKVVCVFTFMLACAHFLCAVFATSFAVIDDPIASLQLSRTRRTTSAGGRDAAGTRKILTLLAREINLLHIAPKIHRTRYRRIYLTRYYTGYYSIFGCCAGYRSCSCSTCRPPTLGCQSCSSRCCRK